MTKPKQVMAHLKSAEASFNDAVAELKKADAICMKLVEENESLQSRGERLEELVRQFLGGQISKERFNIEYGDLSGSLLITENRIFNVTT